MKSNSADYRFIAKESTYHEGGTWCLECYPETRQLPFVGETGCLYIQFKTSITEEEAKNIAKLLNNSVEFFNVIE